MDGKTTIWTLNDAYTLIAGPVEHPVKKSAEEVQAELCNQFGNKIRFGQRATYGNQLMPNIEYFVPIVPKCIGSLFDAQGAPPVLDEIRRYYMNEAGQFDYTYFWDNEIRGYGMKSGKYKGYYSILEETAPNILIGYSQGGLVSRYLLWLDRHVFKKNVITAVITVSSPDFGSPLANPDNEQSVVHGLAEMFVVLLGLDSVPMEKKLFESILYKHMMEFLDRIMKGVTDESHLKGVKTEDKEKHKKFSKFIVSLLDWMGGMRKDPNDAVFDFNICTMEKNYSPGAAQYSVLASVNSSEPDPAECYGVISADMKFDDIFYDGLMGVLLKEFESCIKMNKHIAGFLEKADFNFENFNQAVNRKKFDKVDEIYSRKVMKENFSKSISNPLIQQVVKWHEGGVKPVDGSGITLKAFADDFVIPSAYQLSLDRTDNISGKNFVNSAANHLSGSELLFEGGRKNREQILVYLKEILG